MISINKLTHHRLSWLALITLLAFTFFAPVTDTIDRQIHRLVSWLAPTSASSQIINLTFPDELTDLEKKIRLNDALDVMLKSPPAALVLGGDWSHRTPSWVNSAGTTRPFDSILENKLSKLAEQIFIVAPLYTGNSGRTRHIKLVAPLSEIVVKFNKRPAILSWLEKLQAIPTVAGSQSIIVDNWQELLKFTAPIADQYPTQLLWRWKAATENKPVYLGSLALTLYLQAQVENNDQEKIFTHSTWSIDSANNPFHFSADGTIWPRFDSANVRSDALALLGSQTKNLWANKTVFITPSNDRALRASAATLSALETNAWDYRPGWNLLLLFGFIILFSLYLWLVASNLSSGVNLLLTSLLATLIIIAQIIFAITHHWWLSGISLAVWLVLAQTGLWLFQQISDWFLSHQKSRDEANQMLAVASSEKGQLITAFGYLKRCSNTTYTRDLLYQIGQQMEQKRDYTDAILIYRHLLAIGDKQHEKLHDRIDRLKDAVNVLHNDIQPEHARTMLLPETGLHHPQLGRYQIDKVIGQGSMGVVYLGSDPKIGRRVAIKTLALSSEFAGHDLDEAKERFYREAETAGQLRHPNIVTIYDVGEEQDLAYIAMDYLHGRPLNDFIRHETLLPIVVVYQLILQAAEALDYAHSQGIVHRDIKPGNLIYNADEEQVVITDFGIACVTDNSKTRTGTILGSPYYMSPEQLAGTRVDGRADIFSLGVTFYQLLTGTLPFKGDNLASLTYSIANQKHTPLKKQRSDLPPSAARIINKSLQKKREHRFQNAAEMAEVLEVAISRIN